jgi:TolB-like protein/class 3 adenylate cyclase/Tfp pilus assembly protein PilF
MASTRRLAAILAADVAGYSRLMGADEEGTLERLKAHRRQLVDPKIAEHRGRIVKTTGDGLLAEFPSVVDAVRCAAEVQRGMLDREPELPDEQCIRFRVGINLGDVIAEGGDIFGDGVNVAARLEALAEPGGVCVSGTVRDQIHNRLPYPLEDRGEQSVKNIALPVRVYALRPEAIADLPATAVPIAAPRRGRLARVAIAAAAAAALTIAIGAWWLWPATKPSPTPAVAAATSIAQPLIAPRLSIVVLPFANLSSDPDQQYFADGITEDVTTDLSRIANSFVISRNTAFTYRNKPVDTKQIGRELGVRYVLEGSVQRSGNQVRVTAQLIDAATNAHLWAERFDRQTGDLFALQNEITSRIATALNVELISREAARPTDNPDALDYILRARAVYTKPLSRENHAEAVSLYERALALDPRSVAAQSGLAGTLAGRVLDEMTDSAADDIRRAQDLIGQALASSPYYPGAHFARGQLLRAQGRPEEAILEYEMVIAVNRNAASAYVRLGWCKLFIGSIKEATPLYEQAIRLSPRDPFIRNWYLRLGQVQLLQSRADEAIRWLEQARSANPVHPTIRAWLASAYGLQGETDRAAPELAEARRLSSDDRYSSIARLKATGISPESSGYWGVPKVRHLFEATYFAGLRKAGVPEE